eukprot:TRINITY_DN10227_c0_g1_i1.p1 TRINITY_DN10227_c0_g1~~TRINITY_DN10227_c0_g1_i1.p1  ORF type:complete len:347 (+),score=19.78 TRINITY_DN10227_c0_g1_i1:111-1151(+)
MPGKLFAFMMGTSLLFFGWILHSFFSDQSPTLSWEIKQLMRQMIIDVRQSLNASDASMKQQAAIENAISSTFQRAVRPQFRLLEHAILESNANVSMSSHQGILPYVPFFLRSSLCVNPPGCKTMVRKRRMETTCSITQEILRRQIPGALVETGVAGGGMSAMMLKLMHYYSEVYPSVPHRTLYCADSWLGLQPSHPVDVDGFAKGNFFVSWEDFQDCMRNVSLPDSVVLRGFIKDTITDTVQQQIGSIAFLRIDVDMYQPTLESLELLYPLLVKGGVVYVDDYGEFVQCRTAVDEYRRRFGITDRMYKTYENCRNGQSQSAFWIKDDKWAPSMGPATVFPCSDFWP